MKGAIHPDTGWVMDFADIRKVVDPLIEQLDHQFLNEIEGLSKPTAEVITRWVWHRLKLALPNLCRLELYEAAKCGCAYEGENEPNTSRSVSHA